MSLIKKGGYYDYFHSDSLHSYSDSNTTTLKLED